MKSHLRRVLKRLLAWLDSHAEDQNDVDEHQLLLAVLGEVKHLVWVDSLDKTRSLMNLGDYEGLFDRPRSNLEEVPLDWMNAIHPDDRPAVEAALPDHLTGEFDLRYRVVHGDGAVKWLHDRAFLLFDAQGEPAYQAGLVIDVTERVALEEHALHDQKVKAMGALAGGICHDFNNALAVIQGNIELELSSVSGASRDVDANLQAALGACQRAATLTQRLLSYARKQPLNPVLIEPKALLATLGSLLQRSLLEAIDVEIVPSAGLWRCKADRGELETVLLNLAINAQHAMSKQGKLTIEVYNCRVDEDYARAHEEVSPGQYVCFAVTDNGIGMSPDIVEQAFDPFFTTKGAGEGSGLGLSMAYGFAKQSGGHIKIYSEPGAGTTVKLYLPRSGEEPEAVPPRLPLLRAGALRGKSVLIVDNDEDVRRAVDLQVRALGCMTMSVGSAAEALSLVESGQVFELILLDVVLGGTVEGPELAKQIKAIVPGVKTLFMSGFTENAVIHDGAVDTGVTLLQKPFTRDQLLLGLLRAYGTENQ